jgi:microcystin-dependent protein
MIRDNANSPQFSPPVVAEIRLFGCGFAPAGWDVCDGREIRIADRQPLFWLLGWRFGGDGWTTFALPDLSAELASSGLVPAVAVRGVPVALEAAHV